MQQTRSSGRPLRVLHVIPTLSGGGAENFLCALAPAFDRSVVLAGIMSVYPTDVPPQIRGRVPIIGIGRRGRYDLGFFGRMVAGMRQFRPDVVHTHLHNGKYWGRLAALRAGIPVVLFTEHNPCGERRILPEVVFDRAVNRHTAGIITFAAQQRSYLAHIEGIAPEKISIIENGISLLPPVTPDLRSRAREQLGVAADQLAVIVLARLIARKNQGLAIDALAQLEDAISTRIRLYFIGSGEDDAMLRAYARERDVASRVRFMGNRDDAQQLLYGADVFYMPSLAEGMPIAMLEAMSVGIPIITTPWTGVHELLRGGDLGTILPDWDPQTSARSFAQALQPDQGFAQRAAAAEQVVRERHSIERVARLHETLYSHLALAAGVG